MVGTEGSQVAETIGWRGRWRARAAFDVVSMGGATGATDNGAVVIVTGQAMTAKMSPEGRCVESSAVGVGHSITAEGSGERFVRLPGLRAHFFKVSRS